MFQVGDEIQWTFNNRGLITTKTGIVCDVLLPGTNVYHIFRTKYPTGQYLRKTSNCLGFREGISYLVMVTPEAGIPIVYWPHTSRIITPVPA